MEALDLASGATAYAAAAAPTQPLGAVGAALSALLVLWFAACCTAAALIDARERRIPNAASGCLALGALAQAALRDLAGLPVLTALPAAGERLLWAAGLGASLLLFELVWRRSHGGRHGMGLGDVKLAAAATLWLGALGPLGFAAACAAAALAALVRRRSSFALGPYLAGAFGACLLLALAA